MKKTLKVGLLLILILSLLPLSAIAKKQETEEKLSKQEIKILKRDVGLNDEEIADFPVDFMRELIDLGGKKVAHTVKFADLDNESGEKAHSGEVSIQDLEAEEIKLEGYAFKITSDRAGSKKFRLYGKFKWLIKPYNKLDDAFSIGYPDSTKFYYNTKDGKILGFASQYCRIMESDGSRKCNSINYYPADADPGTGVGQTYDLLAFPEARTHYGDIRQDVYVDDTESGTTNIRFRYAHYTWDYTPAFSIYPTGFAVTPESGMEKLDYWITLNY
jgi:hypothetical protein